MCKSKFRFVYGNIFGEKNKIMKYGIVSRVLKRIQVSHNFIPKENTFVSYQIYKYNTREFGSPE